jgi:hypothetical protein
MVCQLSFSSFLELGSFSLNTVVAVANIRESMKEGKDRMAMESKSQFDSW